MNYISSWNISNTAQWIGHEWDTQLVTIFFDIVSHHWDCNCLNSIRHATVCDKMTRRRSIFPLFRTFTIAKAESRSGKRLWPSPRKFLRIFAHPWPNCIYKIFFLFSAKYFPNVANTCILIAKRNSCDLSENSKHMHLRSVRNVRTSLMLTYTDKALVKKFGSTCDRRGKRAINDTSRTTVPEIRL